MTYIMALLGAIIGSFLNVVITRLPIMVSGGTNYNLWYPCSHCTACKNPIKIWHNIPVISYILLKGRCATCDHAIPIRYIIVELLTAVCFIFIYKVYHVYSIWLVLAYLVFISFIICLVWIDCTHLLLPDSLTIPFIWLGLLFNIHNMFTSLTCAVIGAIAGYMFLWCILWSFKLVTKRDGLGYGDLKLLAALCAWLGYTYIPFMLLIASIGGITYYVIHVIYCRICGRLINRYVPFGPFLSFGGMVIFLAYSPYNWIHQAVQLPYA